MAEVVASMDVPEEVLKVVAAIADKQGFKTPKYQIERGSTDRDGYCSSVYRIKINDKDRPDKAELRIICKKSMPHNGDLMLAMFKSEGNMYENVLPVLEEVARLEKPLPWPKCFHVAVDGPLPHFIAVGDLQPDGFRMADRRTTLDAAHCRLAVLQLARLHGAGLALQFQRPDEFNALRSLFHNPWGTPEMRANCIELFVACQKAPDIIKDKFPKGSEVNTRLKKLFASSVEDNIAMMFPFEGPGFTIIHGDCHSNNMMFQYDKAGAVTGCCLIDYQTAFYGNPAIDLCTLLLVCADKEMRDANWNSLMKEYHTKLQDTLRDAGCSDPDAIYSWDLLQSHLSNASAYGMAMMPMYFNGLYADDEVIKEFRLAMEMAGNQTAPASKLEFRETPFYKRCLEGAVQNMVDWGWLPSVAEIDQRLAAHADFKRHNSQRRDIACGNSY